MTATQTVMATYTLAELSRKIPTLAAGSTRRESRGRHVIPDRSPSSSATSSSQTHSPPPIDPQPQRPSPGQPPGERNRPMKLTVAVCRKDGRPNFSSEGATCSLELELDQVLLDSPVHLSTEWRRPLQRRGRGSRATGLGPRRRRRPPRRPGPRGDRRRDDPAAGRRARIANSPRRRPSPR